MVDVAVEHCPILLRGDVNVGIPKPHLPSQEWEHMVDVIVHPSQQACCSHFECMTSCPLQDLSHVSARDNNATISGMSKLLQVPATTRSDADAVEKGSNTLLE